MANLKLVGQSDLDKPVSSGRPTKYTDINIEKIEKFCKLGSTVKVNANPLEISKSTINPLKCKYPELTESVTQGK